MNSSNEQFIQKAFQSGLTEDQVRAALSERNRSQPQQPKGFDIKDQGFVGGLVSAIVDPFITTGKVIGAAGAEGLRGVRTLQGKDPFFDIGPDGKKTPVQNPFLTEDETQEIAQNPLGFLGGQIGRSAEIASYAIPFGGKANTVFGKTIGPTASKGLARATQVGLLGATRGGITGAAEGSERIVPEKRMSVDEKIDSTLKNIAVGGLTGAVISLVADKLMKGKLPQNTVQKYSDTTVHVQKLSPEVQNNSALAKVGRDMVAKQYNVPRNAAMRLHLRETVQQLDDYNLTNIDRVREVVPKVTGDKGVITQITREASQTAKPIRTDGLLSMAKEVSLDPSLPPGIDTKFVDFMKKGIIGLPDVKSRGVESAGRMGVGDPARTFDFIQSLEAKAAQLVHPKAYSVVSDQNVALSDAYRLMADELKTRLFVESGADKVAINLAASPKYQALLKEVSPKLAERASQVSTLGELRSLAAPFVRAGQAIEITDAGEFLVFNNLIDAVNKGGNMFSRLSNVPLAAMQTNTARAGIGGALMNAMPGQQITAPVGQALNTGGGNILLNLLLGGQQTQ